MHRLTACCSSLLKVFENLLLRCSLIDVQIQNPMQLTFESVSKICAKIRIVHSIASHRGGTSHLVGLALLDCAKPFGFLDCGTVL